MRGFLLNRLSQSLVLLVIVSIIGFAILNLMPGGPLSQFALDPGMTQARSRPASRSSWASNRPLCDPVFRLGLAPAAGRLGPLLPRRRSRCWR